jgi:hypothetical protein
VEMMMHERGDGMGNLKENEKGSGRKEKEAYKLRARVDREAAWEVVA